MPLIRIHNDRGVRSVTSPMEVDQKLLDAYFKAAARLDLANQKLDDVTKGMWTRRSRYTLVSDEE